MTSQEKIDQYVMQTYGRFPVTFVRGEGCLLWDDQGKSYIDFLAGIAVCGLGHANPEVAEAVCAQAKKLLHVSNLFYTEPQARVAELLVQNSFADRVFFCNSGAEANEGALKLSRLWGKAFKDGAHEVVTIKGSFHGRTMATLSATGQEKIQKGYDPLVSRFKYAPWGDLEAITAAVDEKVCAVMLEPILGEGGVVPPPEGYLSAVRRLCDKTGTMLIFDEIQTGLGRTGKLFAHEHFGVKPDVMTLAKGLGNGLPVGAVCATSEAAALFQPGSHATTFGAGPLIMEAARVVLETLLRPGFLERVQQAGKKLRKGLEGLCNKYPGHKLETRGLGLMRALLLPTPGAVVVKKMLQRGFVINCTQDKILRFVPPLIIDDAHIDALIGALDEMLAAGDIAAG